MEEEITQKAICEEWALSKQTVNNAILDLRKKGYISLLESETDRRSKKIILTKSGREFAEKHIETIFKMEESIFCQMNIEEREHLISSNAKYLKLLQNEISKG